MLVLIGLGWLDAQQLGQGALRLDDPDDPGPGWRSPAHCRAASRSCPVLLWGQPCRLSTELPEPLAPVGPAQCG